MSLVVGTHFESLVTLLLIDGDRRFCVRIRLVDHRLAILILMYQTDHRCYRRHCPAFIYPINLTFLTFPLMYLSSCTHSDLIRNRYFCCPIMNQMATLSFAAYSIIRIIMNSI